MERNFEKHDLNTLNNFGVEYDYDSVLHYSSFAFAINKKQKTIIPLKDLGDAKMGQRERLSKKDIEIINKMYCEKNDRTGDEVYYEEPDVADDEDDEESEDFE
jgi:hypothetical protein